MIVAIALATSTAPADWWGEDDATLATALELLHEQQQRVERESRR
jgi:hypothetical protein